MTSRKDYRAMAEILATSDTVREVTVRLAHYLLASNAQFDHDRFMAAATPAHEHARRQGG